MDTAKRRKCHWRKYNTKIVFSYQRPSDCDKDRLDDLIYDDPHQLTRELVSMMNWSQSTIVGRLHFTGSVQKLVVQVLHVLSENNKNQRVNICAFAGSSSFTSSTTSIVYVPDGYWWQKNCCLYVNGKKENRKDLLSLNGEVTPQTKAGTHPGKLM